MGYNNQIHTKRYNDGTIFQVKKKKNHTWYNWIYFRTSEYEIHFRLCKRCRFLTFWRTRKKPRTWAVNNKITNERKNCFPCPNKVNHTTDIYFQFFFDSFLHKRRNSIISPQCSSTSVNKPKNKEKLKNSKTYETFSKLLFCLANRCE